MNRLLNSCLDLLYPPLCLNCDGVCEEVKNPFCRVCSELLTLIEPRERCQHCFCDLAGDRSGCCADCASRSTPIRACAAAFDYYGPAGIVVRQIKYGGRVRLAEGAGAFLAVQWSRLGWPLPDCIVPVPTTLFKKLSRGYNPAELLANSFAEHLGAPCKGILKRKLGEPSQAGLSHAARLQLSGKNFFLKPGVARGRLGRILLIDDVMTTGTTLLRCAEVLAEAGTGEIYTLAFARSSG